MSLRARLLAVTLLLLAVTLAVVGFAVHRGVERSLAGQTERELELTRRAAKSGLTKQGASLARSLRKVAKSGTYAAVLSPSGAVLAEVPAANGDRLLVDPAVVAEGLGRKAASMPSVVRSRPSGRRYLVSVARFRRDRLLVVGLDLHDRDETLHRLLVLQLVLGAAGLGLAGIGGTLLIRWGLRPIRRIIGATDQIARGNLGVRLPDGPRGTEIGSLTVALNRMLDELDAAFAARAQSEARLRRFVADASHDLRTPLTSIQGYAELFRRGGAERPQALATSLRRIEEEAARMGIVLEDLLTLALMDREPLRRREKLRLDLLVRTALDDVRIRDGGRSVSAQLDEVTVDGDSTALAQVIENILDNAIKHTPPGTPIDVRLERDGEIACLAIADRGPGMTDGEAARAFERFWRAGSARSSSPGSGLGLAIAKSVVEAHGGSVEVDTAPGEGARFIVRLPVTGDQRADSQGAGRFQVDPADSIKPTTASEGGPCEKETDSNGRFTGAGEAHGSVLSPPSRR